MILTIRFVVNFPDNEGFNRQRHRLHKPEPAQSTLFLAINLAPLTLSLAPLSVPEKTQEVI